MLVSRDTVEIDTTRERIFEWFRHLDDNYARGIPDHVSCRHVRGHDLQDGAVLYAEEYLHGRLHRLKFRLTEVEAGREFRYRIFPGVSGGFRTRPTEKGTEFVAEIFLGWSVPVFGGLVDAILKVLFSNHVGAIRQHMREEGINLRALLSAGTASVERAAEYGD